MNKEKIRIALFDDHFVVRMGLTSSLNMEADMSVVAEGSDGLEVQDIYRRTRPDVAILDLRLPGLGGLGALQGICQEFPDARVIMLSTYDADEDIYRAFTAGAWAYLQKAVLRDELLRAIRTVHGGDRYVPPSIASRLAQRLRRPELSAREMDVLKLIVTGKSNKEIAAILSITEMTVKNHVSSILCKLGANDRTEAVTSALQRGIVHLD